MHGGHKQDKQIRVYPIIVNTPNAGNFSTLLTAISVSICGIIGWIGMVVPHISRFLVGADYPKLAATSFFIGGIFLLLIDNLIRGATNINLPLGVVTSLIGSPIFVLLLARTRKEWR